MLEPRAPAPVPPFLYGTAWKEQDTARCVRDALAAGFRGIDTANQRRHYFEAGVGEALEEARNGGLVRRQDVFLQTKFTLMRGQDHRLPYDPEAPLAGQVRQSLESSLEHLRADYIDSLVLHGPVGASGLTGDDWQMWRAMETLHGEGLVRYLGLSNVSLEQLEDFCAGAGVKPAFVQNRCFAATGWDRSVREFCRENAITYQGFSLLTANGEVLRHRALLEIAERNRMSLAQAVFRFALEAGMLPLTGTTDPGHMAEDLAVLDMALAPEDVSRIEQLGTQ